MLPYFGRDRRRGREGVGRGGSGRADARSPSCCYGVLLRSLYIDLVVAGALSIDMRPRC